jgi:hypothetical protein
MRLNATHKHILQSMAGDYLLKSHRYLDGRKQFQLHPLAGQAEEVTAAVVHYLERQGLIDSNKKFPAATYWLTNKGKLLVSGQNQEEIP